MKIINNKSKKANVVGYAIIALAVLLLLGSMSFETSSFTSSSSSSSNRNSGSSSSNSNSISNYDLESEVLFQINDTVFGKEIIKSTSFPNMKIGTSKMYETIYEKNNIEISNSAFSQKDIIVEIDYKKYVNNSNFLGVLIMPFPQSGTFESEVGIFINNNLFSVESSVENLPLFIDRNEFDKSIKQNFLTIKTPSVEWYEFAKSYSNKFSEVHVVAVLRDELFDSRNLDFLVTSDEEHLTNVQLKFSVKCPEGEDGSTPIEAYVNSFKVMSQNPTCATLVPQGTVLSAQIPLSILKEKDEVNNLKIETFGKYETSLLIEEVSFNEDYTYTFNVNNNRRLHDVILYADFNQEAMDIKLNSYRFSIPRKETVSIKNKLRSGKNVLTINDIPIEIDEFTIEQVNRD